MTKIDAFHRDLIISNNPRQSKRLDKKLYKPLLLKLLIPILTSRSET